MDNNNALSSITPGLPDSARITRAALLVMVALVIAAYWPGLEGGFTFDDYSNIVANSNLHVSTLEWSSWVNAAFSSPSSMLQRPLAMLSFGINHYFTGLDPRPMKLVNIAIHVTNALLVFGLTGSILRAAVPARSITYRNNVALFVSGCWALMPINLMAVLLIVQRMESMSHIFVFAGLWLYILGRLRQHAGHPGWALIIAGVLGGTVLGVACKESAALLPLYAALTELLLFRFQDSRGRKDHRLQLFFLVVLVVPTLLAVGLLLPRALDPTSYSHRNFSLSERLLTEPRILLDYLRWSIAPDLGELSLFHDDYPVSRPPWSAATILGWIFIVVLLLLIWLLRNKRPLIALGLAFFLAAHVLTATFIPLELVFEHRNYFASLGLCLVLADLLLFGFTDRQSVRVGGSIAVILVSFYGLSTYLRANEWSNPLRFSITEAAKHPASPRATYQLAQQFAMLSNGEANSPFTAAAFKAFEQARAVPRAGIAPAQGLLLLAVRTGSPIRPEWWSEIKVRLRDYPIGPQELGALGALTDCSASARCPFPPGQMLEVYLAAMSQGDSAEVFNLYANYALNVLGDFALAESLWRRAHELNPSEYQYLASLAKLMIALERPEDALKEIRLLRSLGKFGQFENAAKDLERRLVSNARNRTHPRNPR